MRTALPALLLAAALVVWRGLPRPPAQRVEALLAPPSRSPVPALRWGPAGRRVLDRLGAVRRRQRDSERAVEACTVLAAELRSGRSPTAALEAAAEVAGDGVTGLALRRAAGAATLGGDVPAALCAPGSPLLRGLAACWAVCAATGSGLASAVERLGEAERAAADQRRAVDVELAGPQTTARMLAMLPAVGLLMASGLGAAPLSFLLGTTAGRICLLLGVGLEVLGLRWTARLAARARRPA